MKATLKDRFWSKVDKRGKTDCWPWQACRIPDGYGMINVDGRGRIASRVSWELTNGPIPKNLRVCHHCDNPLCVNPNHLFLGSQKDNGRDMSAKGRAHHSKKTHCPAGHPYTEENIYRYQNSRFCRLCRRINNVHRKRIKRAKLLAAGQTVRGCELSNAEPTIAIHTK